MPFESIVVLLLLPIMILLTASAAREAKHQGERGWYWAIVSSPIGAAAWYLWGRRARNRDGSRPRRQIDPWP